MKNIIYKKWAGAAAAISLIAGTFALGSCSNDAIEPLSGKYAKPEVYTLNKVLSTKIEKGTSTRTFSIEFASEGVSGSESNYSGTGAVLSMQFVANNYFLPAAAYTPAAGEAAKNGNYIVGDGASAFYTVSGGSAQPVPVNSGALTVAVNGSDYTLKGFLWLADESVIEVNAAVKMEFEADPEPVLLNNVLSANNNLMNGTNTVSMQLAQEGLSSYMDPNTYQTIWVGEGNYLSVDLYSTDGYLHEGKYRACAEGGNVGESEFGIGYDTTVDWGWGQMEMKDWGTCLWTVAGGAATAQKILEGTITVTRTATGWTIELVSGEGKDMIWAKFTGAIDDLTDPSSGPGAPEYTELSKLISAQSNSANGVQSITFNFASEGVEATYDTSTWSMVYSGSGNYLALDIYSADGALHTGTYSASAVGGTIGEGEFGIGYDTEMWGMSFTDWGTCWWTVDNGATSAEKVLDGTVTVSIEGGNTIVILESSAANARFTYSGTSLPDNMGGSISVVE